VAGRHTSFSTAHPTYRDNVGGAHAIKPRRGFHLPQHTACDAYFSAYIRRATRTRVSQAPDAATTAACGFLRPLVLHRIALRIRVSAFNGTPYARCHSRCVTHPRPLSLPRPRRKQTNCCVFRCAYRSHGHGSTSSSHAVFSYTAAGAVVPIRRLICRCCRHALVDPLCGGWRDDVGMSDIAGRCAAIPG